ncbi:MAG: MFS transporter, partial [Alicyclobacillus sp.]|nr:MFS transporter [Alicyclobacillus sp.]
MAETALTAPATQPTLQKGAVWTLCAGHLVNDLCTVGLVPALLPLYKAAFHLNYTQTGLIVLLSYLTSSVSQPLFGWWTDRKPRPWFVPAGVALSSGGLAVTGLAPSYGWVLLAICLSGLGSAVFHPEAMRGTHLAAGQARGLAQAIFQVGGNAGLALGPLMLPLFILATGLRGVTAFLLLSAVAFALTWRLLPWFRRRLQEAQRHKRQLTGENRVWAVLLFCLVVIMRSWSQIGVAGFLPFYYQHQN